MNVQNHMLGIMASKHRGYVLNSKAKQSKAKQATAKLFQTQRITFRLIKAKEGEKGKRRRRRRRLIPINRIPRPLPPSPNPFPKNIKQKRNRNQPQCNKPQHTTRPANPEIMKHNTSEQRKRAGEHTPQESISRDSTGGYFLERVDEVVQGCLEDGEEAETHEDGADVGCDPRDVLGALGGEVVVACPGEAEEAACKDDGAEHHRWETGFGDGEVVVCFEAGDVEALVEEVDDGAEEDADEEGEEGEGTHDLVPAADFLEDNGEGGEAEVEDAVDEGGVEGDEEADGGCEELEGTD